MARRHLSFTRNGCYPTADECAMERVTLSVGVEHGVIVWRWCAAAAALDRSSSSQVRNARIIRPCSTVVLWQALRAVHGWIPYVGQSALVRRGSRKLEAPDVDRLPVWIQSHCVGTYLKC